MDRTLVDDVLAGRRLPYSRRFALAGFSRQEAEDWRRAGWRDADEAAAWRPLGEWCTPRELRTLSREGFLPEDVAHVARWFPAFTAAWVRALAGGAFSPDDVEIDLRERVRQNLHRDQPRLRVATADRR